ncbi:hypothetical protein [Pseudarthrobacter sp. L1SW]|nr:hypothetical protein [Pseudarthrobacter sp. L1SW]UEL27757.1 hypothetical protein KTR40_14320 [Pseudarthrobacter sp. L1SW]
MANAIERKHGRRRGPGPATGGRRPVVILAAVLVLAAALAAYFLFSVL